eukprot:995856-Karenia_brevis.AAC.1
MAGTGITSRANKGADSVGSGPNKRLAPYPADANCERQSVSSTKRVRVSREQQQPHSALLSGHIFR